MSVRTRLLTIGILAGLSTLSTLSVSCGGGSSTPLTQEAYCEQRASKECNKVRDTCSVPVAACEAARKTACLSEAAAILAVPSTPRVFTPANVAACVNKAGAVYAQATIKPADLAALDDTCQYVFQGDVALLATCAVKYDCKDRGNTICDKGHCATQVTKGSKLQCNDYGAICVPTEYCMQMADTKVCVAKKGVGETCDAATPCLDTLRCSGGKCAALLMAADHCCNDDDCPTTAPYCNPYAGYECGTGLTFASHAPSCTAFGDTEATPPTGAPTCAPGGGTDAGTDGSTD